MANKKTDLVKREPTSTMLMKTASKLVLEGLAQVAELLSRELNPDQAAAAYRLVNDEISKPVKDIREMAREGLLNFAAEHGEKVPNSRNQRVQAGAYTITRKVSLKTHPDEAQLRAYLKAKKVDPATVFDQVVTYVLNPTKLEQLFLDGKLDRQTVEQLRPVHSISLEVK